MDNAGETRSDARMETSEGPRATGKIATGRALLLMTIAGDRPPRYGKVWSPFVSPTVLHRDREGSPTSGKFFLHFYPVFGRIIHHLQKIGWKRNGTSKNDADTAAV